MFRGPLKNSLNLTGGVISRILQRSVTDRAWNVAKVGKFIIVDNVPYKVTKAQQGGRGRGSSFVKCTVKNLFTSKVVDKTFNSDDQLEVPIVTYHEAQYSWMDTSSGTPEYVFMDSTTFEEIRAREVSQAQFLQEGAKVTLMKYNDQVVDVDLPSSGVYTVVSIGDTPLRGGMAAKLCTGAVVSVPGHIKEGMKINVNVMTESYSARVL